jgi:hypothetical protein
MYKAEKGRWVVYIRRPPGKLLLSLRAVNLKRSSNAVMVIMAFDFDFAGNPTLRGVCDFFQSHALEKLAYLCDASVYTPLSVACGSRRVRPSDRAGSKDAQNLPIRGQHNIQVNKLLAQAFDELGETQQTTS